MRAFSGSSSGSVSGDNWGCIIPDTIVLFSPLVNQQNQLADLKLVSCNATATDFCQKHGLPLVVGEGVAEPFALSTELLESINRSLKQQGNAILLLRHRDLTSFFLRLTAAADHVVGQLAMSTSRATENDSADRPPAANPPNVAGETPIYQQLVDHLKQVVFQADLNGRWTFLSPAWKDITGFSVEESLLQFVGNYVLPEDRQQNRRLAKVLIGRRRAYCRYQIRCLHKQDGFRWIEVFAQLDVDDTGTPIGITGTLTDITQQKQREETRTQTEQTFRSVFYSTFQMMVLLSADGAIIDMNDAACAAMGKPPDELYGCFLWETQCWLHTKDRQSCQAAVRKAADGLAVRYETEVLRANQEVMVTDFSVRPLFSQTGSVEQLVVECHDITNIKRSQQAFAESEKRFREIAEKVDSMIWVRDIITHQFVYMNPVYEQLTGRSCESLYENPSSILDFVLEEDLPDIVQMLSGQGPVTLPFILRLNLPRGLTYMEVRGFRSTDETGNAIRRIGVATDITSQIERKNLLEKALEREQELNGLKSLFVSMASHQFRTPLTTIQSSAELLGLLVGRDKPEHASDFYRHIDRITGEVERVTDILADILMLGRCDSGKIILSAESVNFSAFIRQLLKDYFSALPDGQRVDFMTESEEITACIDKKLMSHVLQNLLTNAVKFSRTSPQMILSQDGDTIRIQIIDDGIGIPSKDLPHLFEPFYRASNALEIQGTGLGLSIASRFVELHGGTIQVESQPGEGTRFTINLKRLC